MSKFIKITIETEIKAPIELIWETWNNPKHVVNWNHASDDWHSPKAINDFEVGGKFVYRMESKDGRYGFDFSGTYVEIQDYQRIVTKLDDNRSVITEFIQKDDTVKVVETFEAEDENTIEQQRQGWLAILMYYKEYTENLEKTIKVFVE